MPKILTLLKLNRRGASAIMALVVLSLILASALAVTSLLLNAVKVSLNAENVVASAYVAESGVEKALYYIKYSREQSNFSYYLDLSLPANSQETLSNKGKFTIKTSSLTNPDFTVYDVTTSSPAHVDIIDPSGKIDNVTWPSNPSEIPRYTVAWKIDNCYPDHASDRMEITAYSFGTGYLDPSGLVAAPDVSKNIYVCNCKYSAINEIISCDSIGSGDLATNRYYRFVLRPLDGTVKKLTFSLSAPGIYSQALIEVDGTYNSSQYRLSANLPTLSPTSDIFSYVIFSEEELNK